MSDKPAWDDASREDLRESIRNRILGELRLTRRSRDEILESCDEVDIQDVCPADERAEFRRFAADEIKRVAARIEAEKSTWPEETDCDRLDRVEAALRERGILLWQASPCCDTCSGAELPDRIAALETEFPGIRDRLRGYAFFIDQNLPEMLADGTELSVYLAYGWFTSHGGKAAPEVYETHALGIAREVCDCLREHGFEPDWNGKLSRKIGVRLDWRRRTPLS